MTDRDRHHRLGRTMGEWVGVRSLHRQRYLDDPRLQRELRPRASRPRPLRWGRWLLVGIVAGMVLAGTSTFLLTGDDDQALGRVLLAALAGALAGWVTIVVVARLGALRRDGELHNG